MCCVWSGIYQISSNKILLYLHNNIAIKLFYYYNAFQILLFVLFHLMKLSFQMLRRLDHNFQNDGDGFFFQILWPFFQKLKVFFDTALKTLKYFILNNLCQILISKILPRNLPEKITVSRIKALLKIGHHFSLFSQRIMCLSVLHV